MKRKVFRHILMCCILMTAISFAQAVSAEEITLFDEGFAGVYSEHNLSETLWGDLNRRPGYVNGTQWASLWGSGAWFEDSGDTMMVKSKLNIASPENASNTYIYHKMKEQTLPEGSTVVASLDFRTADYAETASTELWYALNFKKYLLALQITSSKTDGFGMGFASSTSWPFNKKVLDRESGGLKLEANTDYRVVLTMSPNPDDTYQLVVELFRDGTKVGAGILNEYNGITPETFTEPNNVNIVVTSNKKTNVVEPFLYLKHANIYAIARETKPEVKFFPQKGGDAAELDGNFYAEFNKAIETIDKSNVTVTGGATVESVVMSEDGKRADFVFSGLKPSTNYDVKINKVKLPDGENEFDYDWSFTTVNSVSFPNVYFEWEKKTGEAEINLTGLSLDNDFTDDAEDNDFTDGNKFYASKLQQLQLIDAVTDSGIGYKDKAIGANAKGTIQKRMNMTYGDGDDIRFKSVFKIDYDESKKVSKVRTSMGLSVVGSENDAKINLVSIARASYSAKPYISLLGVNGGTAIVNNQLFDKVSSDELEVELNLIYNSSDGYDAKIVLRNTVTNEIYYEEEVENCLTKDQAMGLDTMEIEYNLNKGIGSDIECVRFKNFSAEIVGAAKGFAIGENKLYIDYGNITPDTPFDVTFLAVTEHEENGANVIGNVNIFTFENKAGESGTLELPIMLNDVYDGMRLKVYALNGTDGAIPLMKEVIKQ